MNFLDPVHVCHTLKYLRAKQPKAFGFESHGCDLNPVLSEHVLRQFELDHRVTLPVDYRHFLTHVGNGGAGPYYGVFPLGMMDASVGGGLQRWRENDGLVGTLSEPFLLTQAWNDLTCEPDPELSETDPKEYERQLDAFDRTYLDHHRMNGALPVCHIGCARRIWLVITGGQAGRLWRDGRADRTGLSPIQLHDGIPSYFSNWYIEWLSDPAKFLRLQGS